MQAAVKDWVLGARASELTRYPAEGSNLARYVMYNDNMTSFLSVIPFSFEKEKKIII